jgi:hypothetical protein
MSTPSVIIIIIIIPYFIDFRKCLVTRPQNQTSFAPFRGQAVTLLGQQDAISIDEELMATPGRRHDLMIWGSGSGEKNCGSGWWFGTCFFSHNTWDSPSH